MVAKSASCLLEKMSWTLPNFSAKLAVSGSSSLAHLMFGDVSSSICSPLCSQFFKISCCRHVSGSCDFSPHACAEGHGWLGSDHLGDLRRELWFACCDQVFHQIHFSDAEWVIHVHKQLHSGLCATHNCRSRHDLLEPQLACA